MVRLGLQLEARFCARFKVRVRVSLSLGLGLGWDWNNNRWQNCWDKTNEETSRAKLSTLLAILLIQRWRVWFFLQTARTAAQHYMEGMGEGKFYFPFLTLGRGVSTNFVTDCRLKVRIRFWVMFKLRISSSGVCRFWKKRWRHDSIVLLKIRKNGQKIIARNMELFSKPFPGSLVQYPGLPK